MQARFVIAFLPRSKCLLISWLQSPFAVIFEPKKMKCVTASTSVQFSRSAVSDSFWPLELQHARPPCPLPTPGVHPNSCPLSQWCHPTIWSSVVALASCPQSFPASGSFQMSQSFASGGQRLISFPIFATPKFATPRNSKSFPLSCHLSTKIIFLH